MSLTFELQIRFVSAMDDAVPLKRRVLAWLGREGVDQIVESLIDGIEFPLESQGAQESGEESWEPFEASFDDQDDAAPIAVYDGDRTMLESLSNKLRQAFTHGIDFSITAITDESWSMAWDEQTSVIRTEHFVVLSPDAESPDPSLTPLYVYHGEAFGSGRHATTKVALEMLERLYLAPVNPVSDTFPRSSGATTQTPSILSQVKGSLVSGRMLDVGTGNGILLLAGARIGFRELVGTEIDRAVLDEAQRNLALNQVRGRLLLTPKPPLEGGGGYDLVTANILAPVLHDLMPTFAASLTHSGVLLLAGFVAKEEPGIVAVAKKNGLAVKMRGECRGWVGVILQR